MARHRARGREHDSDQLPEVRLQSAPLVDASQGPHPCRRFAVPRVRHRERRRGLDATIAAPGHRAVLELWQSTRLRPVFQLRADGRRGRAGPQRASLHRRPEPRAPRCRPQGEPQGSAIVGAEARHGSRRHERERSGRSRPRASNLAAIGDRRARACAQRCASVGRRPAGTVRHRVGELRGSSCRPPT